MQNCYWNRYDLNVHRKRNFIGENIDGKSIAGTADNIRTKLCEVLDYSYQEKLFAGCEHMHENCYIHIEVNFGKKKHNNEVGILSIIVVGMIENVEKVEKILKKNYPSIIKEKTSEIEKSNSL